MQPAGLWQTLGVSTLHDWTWLYAPLFLSSLLYLAAISICDFWVSPPEPIPESLHLPGHFSEPIPAPSPSPLPFLLPLLISKTLTTVPPLSHFLTSPLTIFSRHEAATLYPLFLTLGRVFFTVFSICDIEHIDAQLFLCRSTPPAFGSFNNPYSDQGTEPFSQILKFSISQLDYFRRWYILWWGGSLVYVW